jgi:hypothetical protein
MKKYSIEMPSLIPGDEMQRIANTVGGFAATVVDCDKFSDAEKRAMFIRAKEFTDFIAMYTARYDLESPDLIWLDKSLQMLRRMLTERGLLADRDTDERLEPCS